MVIKTKLTVQKTKVSRSTTPRRISPAVETLTAKTFAELPWLVHGFSTREGGVSTCYGEPSLNFGLTPDDSKENVLRNRALFLEALDARGANGQPWPLVQLKQIHSGIVHSVSAAPEHVLAGDGLITDTPGFLLTVKTADCAPILVVDCKHKAVGVFHAGWRGTVARIVEKGVGEMRRRFGSDPKDLRAAIGPCIRRCCYKVGDEVRTEFESQFRYAGELFHEAFNSHSLHVRYPLLFLNQRAPGHGDPASELHLDLVEANVRQLQAAGLPMRNIEIIEGCTSCDTSRFFSHRAECGKTGRMMAAIGVRAG